MHENLLIQEYMCMDHKDKITLCRLLKIILHVYKKASCVCLR